MPEFLARAHEAIPSLSGIKYTNADLIAFQECLRVADGAFNILWGTDECLLSALAMGVTGAVGSTYNFAAPVAHQLMQAFANNDLERARAFQYRIVQLVRLLASYGFMGASKALMKRLGVDVGPTRLPLEYPAPEQIDKLQKELGRLGYFDWIAKSQGETVLLR
jgi:N-acetylneuraminate lyase